MEKLTFERALGEVINERSLENRSDTPDYVSAAFLSACFDAFNNAVKARDNWYGIAPCPGTSYEPFSSHDRANALIDAVACLEGMPHIPDNLIASMHDLFISALDSHAEAARNSTKQTV